MIKTGLVVEGGGMRGSHSCGVLMAMVKKGLIHFDVVAGVSAGACTSAFLVSGQFDILPLIWTKHLYGDKFIKYRNLARRKSVMDLDYLIDEVFGKRQPLDVKAIQKSNTRFYITATNCETGQATYFDNHHPELLKALKSSSAIPIAYRQPVVIGGKHYMDGGLSDPIPIQKVIHEGCQKIYVVLTRPAGYRKKDPLLNVLPRFYQKSYPRLAETIANRHALYNKTLERLETGDYPADIVLIRPKEKMAINRFSTNLKKIHASIEQGYQDAMGVLS